MADKYYRLVSFLINLCPEPLRELFLQYAKADTKPGIPYTTLDAYLTSRKPDMLSLKSRRKLRDDQYDLLYPKYGSADESQWDITLLAVLILELFRPNIPNHVDFFIRDIREVRNSLQHLSTTSNMSDLTYQQNWSRLEIATLALAKTVNGTHNESFMKGKIETAKVSNMTELGNTLCLWFMEIKTQMMTEMTEMKEKMTEISEDAKESKRKASESANILQSASMVKPGPSGKPNKRMKIVDKKLKKMQDQFERTLNAEIPEDFNAPTETDRIKDKLRDDHLAIVAGQNNSLYLAAALSAVKDMGYDEKRCVEMQNSSDWCHIDPEDVNFVLCCNPFGKETYDEEKSKGMADIFSSIQHTVKQEGDDKKLAVLIVTDIGVLNECKERYYHDILEEVVTVYHSTSKTQPADLTVARCNANFHPSTSTVSQNLTEFTGLFLDHHKTEVRPDVLKAAKDMFKVHKSVVLVGPPRSGKTSLAVALAASYDPSQVLLLPYPEQVQKVNLNRTHLVIIEDFAGKYGFNRIQICDWYRTFDLLNVMKSAGKLNIIITCNKQKLKRCTEKIATHPLLENSVEVHRQSVLVKQEKINAVDVDQAQPVTVGTVSAPDTADHPGREDPLNLSAPRYSTVVSRKECISLSNIDGEKWSVCTCMCLTQNESMYVGVKCYTHLFPVRLYYLLYHDKNTNNTFKYSVKNEIDKMCCTTAGDSVAVSNIDLVTSAVSILRITDGSLGVIKTTQCKAYDSCRAVSCDDKDLIYTLWFDGTVNIYNISLERIRQYKLSNVRDGYGSKCTISPKGHIFLNTWTQLIYENFKSISSSESKHDNIHNSCICAASEDPYTVFVNNVGSNRLIQYNTKCQIISEITLTGPDVNISAMVFDETSSRLIIYDRKSNKIYEVYLK